MAANNNNNPAPKTPAHHHQGPTAHTGAASHDLAEDDVGPADFADPLIKPDLYGALPKDVAVDEETADAAPQQPAKPPTVMPGEQYARKVTDRLYAASAQDTSQFDDAMGGVFQLSYLVKGADPRRVPKSLPYNYEQVRKGGFAMMRVRKLNLDEVKVMRVDWVKLGKALARGERTRGILAAIDEARAVYLADLADSANEVADIVHAGLKLGESGIKNNAVLLRMLAPSLAIRGGPAEQALQSKDDKAKLEAAIRAEVQGQQPPPAGTPPAGTTTTVTTQSAPPSQGPTGQSPPPSIKGPTSHHRKPPGT